MQVSKHPAVNKTLNSVAASLEILTVSILIQTLVRPTTYRIPSILNVVTIATFVYPFIDSASTIATCPVCLFVIKLHSAASGHDIYLTYFLPASPVAQGNKSKVASLLPPQKKTAKNINYYTPPITRLLVI